MPLDVILETILNNKKKILIGFGSAALLVVAIIVGLEITKKPQVDSPNSTTNIPIVGDQSGPSIKKVDLSSISDIFISPGENILASFQAADNKTPQDFTWSSSSNNVATVDQSGLITAVLPGATIISVVDKQDGGLVIEKKIDIIQPSSIKASSITLNSSDPNLEVGKTLKLGYSILPA
ncbi:MAG: Ig-like domain-containing protein, partial [Candidatus Saccharibacteria bacterium]